MSRIVTILSAMASALALAACHSPPDSQRPGDRTGADVRSGLEGQAPDTPPSPSAATPDLPVIEGLSAPGTEALRTLRHATLYMSRCNGMSDIPNREALAWNVLLKESAGVAAFRHLVAETGPTEPAHFYGLCGLWSTDRAAFRVQAEYLRRTHADAEVSTFWWCCLGDLPIEWVLRQIENGTHSADLAGEQ